MFRFTRQEFKSWNFDTMSSLTPITLLGCNLGQRHRYLNTLVHEAKESGASVQEIEALPEESAVDRLFKIDLAIQLKHVDYIIRSLKDDDMLYVSRALKATWLIDHRDIINPKHLEDVLFPEMIKPAVTKMKHWLYINLRDPATCQEFYQHYKKNSFQFAIKFLSRCSQEFILEEAPKILSKLSTNSLKVLCEKCPGVAKIYFDSLATDEDVKARYLEQDQLYYNSVKCVLKLDADVFLDITEKYFNMNRFSRLSPLATDYILRYHKTRFINKLELYVAYFLHIPTVAARLSVEECQEVVLKLARASYLQYWFQYKVVEPLIKRLKPDKRAAFKKLVFVEKDIGERVPEWPYSTPEPPTPSDTDPDIFDDEDYMPICETNFDFRCMLKKRKCARYEQCVVESCMEVKTDLDRLFDEFRFIGFDRALHDLGQRLGAAGSADRRRDIFLVLVSKSGGRSDAVSALLRLAARHSNEPPHTRASILRSLVKRADVWRLPADVWQYFLDFGHGLGLDGAPSEAACREGLHCVVIRQLLTGECDQTVRDAFLNDFSTLAEYSLKVDERVRVANGLQNMLSAAASDAKPAVAAERLHQLLDVIETYHVRAEAVSPTVEAVKCLALRDANVADSLLERLYSSRIGRRELLRENLNIRRDQRALINALRHDPAALEVDKVADLLATEQSQFDEFISKLVIYFYQKDDLTIQLRSVLKDKIVQQTIEGCKNLKLVRPFTSLLYKDFEKELREFDARGKESTKFAAALRACAHRARPTVNLAEWGWRKAGVKAVATRAMRCREAERDTLTRTLATERRTVRVALALTMCYAEELLLDTLLSAAKLRPAVALRSALSYFRRHGSTADPKVWDIIKPLLSCVDHVSRERLRKLVRKTEWIPSHIKADYCGTLYLVLNKMSKSSTKFVLRDLCMVLPEVKEDIMIENILISMFEKSSEDEPVIAYPAMFIRYLMLSRDHEDLERRFSKVGDRFLEQLDILRSEKDSNFQNRLDDIIKSLKYNAAFLNTKYPSCLSVIERILAWMQKFMPREEYFDKYVHIHLIILYFKAVRQIMKQMPEVFADPKRKKSEGVEAVGFIFGRYVVKEVAELASSYFDSIIELYMAALVAYLCENFSYGISREKFIGSLLKGMLAEAVGIQRRMAVYILSELRYDVKDNTRKEIEEIMVQDKCIKLLVYAEIVN
ncbi:hypothetical protein PYW08_010543 [Mythimna loreyi]|uniref:Uncharacterized protein n=1 Tax=Mythimna loreyi TaxID=667449 RepID=A0ACC2Q5D5_9NEOP|nr:hypothetical protein PYW08_010543 [Mythimna loreyi]